MVRSSSKHRGHAGLLSVFDDKLRSVDVICFRHSVIRACDSGPAGGDGGTAKLTLEMCQPCDSL
jgi:hypothetical protein